MTKVFLNVFAVCMGGYAANWAKKHKQERSPIEAVLDPIKEMLPGHKKERIRQKGMER